ncbi:hypothetical protein [Marivita sp.]|uniref:hypothetical protein n=1 Tax=Marivita sp. TaxID=2003365 RepID=UPI003F6C1823
MAAIALIAGSGLGWIVAGIALATGAMLSTAVMFFLAISLSVLALSVFASGQNQLDPS